VVGAAVAATVDRAGPAVEADDPDDEQPAASASTATAIAILVT
jgi:hypothetical protein